MSDKLTMPTLTILFQQRAQTAIARSQKGVAALILRDALTAGEAWSLTSTGQIPEKLGKENQNAIRRVFKGGVNPPRKVLVYCLGAEDTLEAEAAPQAEDGEKPGGTEEARPGSGAAALRWLGTQRFDYLAGPADLSEAEAAVIQEWIIQKREDDHVIFKAVLPGCAADSEGVVNFTASGIQVGGDVFDAAAYCGRVAGLIAGTPMKQAVTYAALPEVEDQLIEEDFSCDIDVEEQEAYLQSTGAATAEMTEQQIREANTGTYVFLALDIRPIDAIEDVRIRIYL